MKRQVLGGINISMNITSERLVFIYLENDEVTSKSTIALQWISIPYSRWVEILLDAIETGYTFLGDGPLDSKANLTYIFFFINCRGHIIFSIFFLNNRFFSVYN